MKAFKSSLCFFTLIQNVSASKAFSAFEAVGVKESLLEREVRT